METERLSISAVQKQLLTQFYENGMISTKKELAGLHADCAKEVGLSETQVKNWISNNKASKRSSGQQQKTSTSNSVLIRKRSGYNVFAKEELSKGNSEQKKQRFSELGSKWNELDNKEREEYNAKASDLNASSAIQNISDAHRSKRIITNMMNQVSELENIEGAECLVICLHDGSLYHGATKLANVFLSAHPEVITTFASTIQNASFNHKKDVSQKMIQNIFNEKYSTLLGRRSTLPYSKVKELGLEFNGLPQDIVDEVGIFPRKSNLYGQAQRRKLWECRDLFTFVVNPPCLHTPQISSTNTAVPIPVLLPTKCVTSAPRMSPSALQTTSPTSRISTSTASSSTLQTSSVIPPTPTHTSMSVPTFVSPPICPVTTPTAPVTANCIQNIRVLLPKSALISLPAISTTRTSSSVVSPAALSTTSRKPTTESNSSYQASILVTLPTESCSTSKSKILVQLKEGTRFGLMDESNNIRGTGKVTARSTLHGRQIPSNCLVVEVTAMEDNHEMKSPFPGPFDEDEAVEIGGFYAWAITKLSPLP